MKYKLSEIAAIVKGKLIGDDRSVSLFEADIRTIIKPKASLFFAIGPRDKERHDFIAEALALGVKSFLVDDESSFIEGASVIQVTDSLAAFQKLTAHHKSQMVQHGHQTQVKVNLQALAQNLNAYRSLLAPSVKVMAMVKAFGYGNGDVEVARMLAHQQVDYLAVAYVDEGIALRQEGIRLPIMVLNCAAPEFDSLTAHRLEPVLYSMDILESFDRFLRDKDAANYPIHLKFDTGMHRLGFHPNAAPAILKRLQSSNRLEPRSLYSHLYASDAEDTSEAYGQIALFEQVRSFFQTNYAKPLLYHILNSAGISRLGDAHMDMVRLGLGLYGFSLDQAFSKKLSPVISWSSIISQVKEVKQGETVGYGGNFRAEHDMQIAIIALGYADGLSRLLGNGKGYVMIKHLRCPYVGNICMDMSMVDVTGIECKTGDTVTIIGEGISAEAMAEARGTIAYEVLTLIAPRVPRVYVFEE